METLTETAALHELMRRYEALTALVPLRPIDLESEYEAARAALDRLLEAGAGDERHVLADLVATLGALIADYEDLHFPPADVSAVDSLRFLMAQHGLTQRDLPEIGGQGRVADILQGRRALNTRQIKALSARFGVSGALFL